MMRRAGWCVALALSACGPSPGPEAGPEAPPPPSLRPPSDLDFDFMWRQRVVAHWPGPDGGAPHERSFEAVLQKREGELLLVGLSPVGQPGFVIRLDPGGDVSVENNTGGPMPFDPHFVLADVQAVFFPWLEQLEAPQDGPRRGARGPYRVEETFVAGQLARRVITQASSGSVWVDISFRDWVEGADAPKHATLDNQRYGYSLEIETVSQQRLSSNQSP